MIHKLVTVNLLRAALTTAVLVLASFGLAACGGDDESDDEDAITGAIERAATSGDPASCTEDQTEDFILQTSVTVQRCQEDAANTAGESVQVDGIEIDGDSATAEVAFTGATLDGQTLTIAMVKDDDVWKLDQLEGFAEFNKEAMITAFLTELQADEGTPPRVVTCLEQELRKADEEDLQSFVLEPDGGDADQVVGACFQQE